LKQSQAISLVVADTSPLIAIAIMDLFPELKIIFNRVIVPEAVVRECLHDLSKPQSTIIKKALTENILQQHKVLDTEACQILEQILDPGEAEAICLAKQLGAVALIDEKAGRKVAAREDIRCIGSLYVLIKAKQNGSIASVVPLIKRLFEHGYYLDNSLIETVLLSRKVSTKGVRSCFLPSS
jgi:predicted nucleic acid-binding protein